MPSASCSLFQSEEVYLGLEVVWKTEGKSSHKWAEMFASTHTNKRQDWELVEILIAKSSRSHGMKSHIAQTFEGFYSSSKQCFWN